MILLRALQSTLIKNLTAKISTLDEKRNASEASIEKLNDKITNLEGKLAYFESQDELKSRKIDYLKQYGRQESLRFSGFEVKENESKEECESKVKSYIKNCLNVDIAESERLFNKLLLNLKVLFHEQKFIRPGNTKLTSQSIWI